MLLEDTIWKPNSHPQEMFLSLPDTVKECLYGGAVGGGKTEVLLNLPRVRTFKDNEGNQRPWIEHPKFQAIYFRESFPELEKSLIKRAREIYEGPNKHGASYNSQKHSLTFPSGAVIWFDFLETDDDAYAHDTNEYNLLIF